MIWRYSCTRITCGLRNRSATYGIWIMCNYSLGSTRHYNMYYVTNWKVSVDIYNRDDLRCVERQKMWHIFRDRSLLKMRKCYKYHAGIYTHNSWAHAAQTWRTPILCTFLRCRVTLNLYVLRKSHSGHLVSPPCSGMTSEPRSSDSHSCCVSSSSTGSCNVSPLLSWLT